MAGRPAADFPRRPDLEFGGVRGHLRAICRHSALRVQLVPDETALGVVSWPSDEIRREFLEFISPGGASCIRMSLRG